MNAPTEAAFSLSRQREVVAALREQLPAHAVLFNEEDTRPMSAMACRRIVSCL